MKNSKLASFIVDTTDYFAGVTDNDEIRFGLVGTHIFQISKNHAAAESLLNSTTSDDVEAVFDDFIAGVYS